MSQNDAACAHSRIKYVRINNANGTCSDSWRCESECGAFFWPTSVDVKAILADRDAQIAELRVEAENTCRMVRVMNADMRAEADLRVAAAYLDMIRFLRESSLVALRGGILTDHDREIIRQAGEALLDHTPASAQASLDAHDRAIDTKARTEGFELAHELAKCGHARANYRDPNYKPEDAECDSSKCEFCEALKNIAVCVTCGQDVSGPGFAGHRTTFCHKPSCLDAHDRKIAETALLMAGEAQASVEYDPIHIGNPYPTADDVLAACKAGGGV